MLNRQGREHAETETKTKVATSGRFFISFVERRVYNVTILCRVQREECIADWFVGKISMDKITAECAVPADLYV